uniref:uncharacterized protein LOC120343297 n=1 Tax=Styela clava TaxID=7725 RepID=UPI0019394645|nr:uncharacterized protein LOC120343297 [Styela clava]
MENRAKDNEENLIEVETEQAAYKRNFENTYREIGGETTFYLDLDSFRDILLEQIGDDEAAEEEFEEWYQEKQNQKWKRIGVGFLTEIVASAGIGGLAYASLIIGTGGFSIIFCGGVVLMAAAGGAVSLGFGLGVYKLYRMYKCYQFKKAHDAEILPVGVFFLNNDAQSKESHNIESEEATTASNNVPNNWEMSANKAMLS